MIVRATAALIALAGLNAADFKDVDKTVTLNLNGAVTLETHKGSIQVTTWDRAEVEIHARIQAEAGTTMSRRRFDGTEVRIDSSSGAVHILTSYPDENWCCSSDNESNPEVRYSIRMPRTGRLTIRDHRSDTEISDLGGALDIDTHRGTVHVKRLGGPVQLNTHRGSVTIDFAALTGSSVIDTYRGSLELSMPKGTKFDVDADLGRHGSIDSDFPMITRSADRRGQNLHAIVNGGGDARLRIKTEHGNVALRAM